LSYKLIANIPYYITGEIIRKFFEENIQPDKMVLLVQKEVAQRIVARDSKESILSIACKAYSTPKYIQTVKRDAFTPAPNVDSAIIAFGDINRNIFGTKERSQKLEDRFFEVMKLGFAHKRKKLGGNLKEIQNELNREKLEKIKDNRAENLKVEDWVELINQ
jgi:16S rRNA (adenine1518-N6/adenine1519-N6)-dimethyltransferase